ncbi:MAG: hypothetical protein R2911_06655 [Caldilineaceae bacterium]
MTETPLEHLNRWLARARQIMQSVWRNPQQRNLAIGALGAFLLLFFAYRIGLWRGRQLAQRDLPAALAELATPQPTGAQLAIVAPTPRWRPRSRPRLHPPKLLRPPPRRPPLLNGPNATAPRPRTGSTRCWLPILAANGRRRCCAIWPKITIWFLCR